MGFLIGIGEPAQSLVITDVIIHKRERHCFFVTSLLFHLRIVQTAAKASCGSPRLKTAQINTVFLKIFCKFIGRRQAVRTACKSTVSYKNLSSQESSRSQNYSLCLVPCVGLCLNTADLSILNYYISNLALSHIKVRCVFYSSLHFNVIFILISLGTERMNSRTFGGVEHLALDKSLVDIFTHLPAESIDFSYQMALAGSSYRRIAWHHSNSFKIYGKHQSFLAHACRSQSCLTSGVSRSNNYNIIFTH